jgi:serine phosphatase RsbU (regulator of sigma subunit)
VDYITKPFQLEEVLARVETHLTLRDLQRQLQRANHRFERELALAREIQASFLPSQIPELQDWDLAVDLKPAREMSGDFYDVGLLPNGCLFLLVADVVDKGVGAALFMALCNTLIRTYAAEYPADPRRVLAAANARILSDTSSEQFVTAFYGVLDRATGILSYVNAGHDPPCLVNGAGDQTVQMLVRTGMPMGILPDASWEQGTARLAPGDMLVLYTDGIPDAQNSQGQFYGRGQLLQVIQRQGGRAAAAVLEEILSDLNKFTGAAPQLDDIALIALAYRPSAASKSGDGATG